MLDFHVIIGCRSWWRPGKEPSTCSSYTWRVRTQWGVPMQTQRARGRQQTVEIVRAWCYASGHQAGWEGGRQTTTFTYVYYDESSFRTGIVPSYMRCHQTFITFDSMLHGMQRAELAGSYGMPLDCYRYVRFLSFVCGVRTSARGPPISPFLTASNPVRFGSLPRTGLHI